MIKLLTKFEDCGTEDVNYIKIAASIKAYGLGKCFLTVWQTGESLICKQDDYLTIYGEDFEPDELNRFIGMLGVKGITLSPAAAEKLSLPYAEYNVLKSTQGSAVAVDTAPKTDEVYEILKLGADGDIILPERTAFMADLSHRMRHGTAAACVYKGTAVVAPYISEGGALICGVSAGQTRGSGFAGICVAAAVSHIGKPCFVICKDGLLPFYSRYGFKTFSKNAEIFLG